MRAWKSFGLCLLFFLAVAYAEAAPPGMPEETVQASMAAYDMYGSPIPDAALLLKYAGGSTYSVTESDGAFIAVVPMGLSTVDIGADLDATPGYDYMAAVVRVTEGTQQQIVVFAPAGTVSGRVMNGSGAYVAGAQVALACPTYNASTLANSSGWFEFEFAPIGECLASSQAINQSVRVRVVQGEVSTANLAPAPTPAALPSSTPSQGQGIGWIIGLVLLGIGLLIVLVLIAAVVGGMTHLFLSRRNEEVYEEAVEPSSPQETAEHQATPEKAARTGPTGKQLDIMKTLSKREREIAVLLLDNGGKMRASKIRYKLLIPKTSFFRLLTSLENKNIVELKKYENVAEIRLTGWFLSR